MAERTLLEATNERTIFTKLPCPIFSIVGILYNIDHSNKDDDFYYLLVRELS